MKKNLLFVLAAVLLTAMIFGTAMAGRSGPNPDGPKLGPCVCDAREDEAPADGICDNCDRPIPRGDGTPDGEGPVQNKDGSCGD